MHYVLGVLDIQLLLQQCAAAGQCGSTPTGLVVMMVNDSTVSQCEVSHLAHHKIMQNQLVVIICTNITA